jgi:hypothetical protein
MLLLLRSHCVFLAILHRIFESFSSRIATIRACFPASREHEVETWQILERDAWEYTAREFLQRIRFDTLFDVDRFGTILQRLQSGSKKCSGGEGDAQCGSIRDG